MCNYDDSLTPSLSEQLKAAVRRDRRSLYSLGKSISVHDALLNRWMRGLYNKHELDMHDAERLARVMGYRIKLVDGFDPEDHHRRRAKEGEWFEYVNGSGNIVRTALWDAGEWAIIEENPYGLKVPALDRNGREFAKYPDRASAQAKLDHYAYWINWPKHWRKKDADSEPKGE